MSNLIGSTQKLNHFNWATILTTLTGVLSGLQAIYLHSITTDYGHKFFSEYFYFELVIFLLTIFTGFKRNIYVIFFMLLFIVEAVWYFIYERPISPDDLLMLIVGLIRIYVLTWLLKRVITGNKWSHTIISVKIKFAMIIL